MPTDTQIEAQWGTRLAHTPRSRCHPQMGRRYRLARPPPHKPPPKQLGLTLHQLFLSFNPKDDVRYKVGIDVGLNSMVFALSKSMTTITQSRLLNSLVFRHDAGIDPASRKAALTRKNVSGVARRNRRAKRETKKRLVALDRLLSEEFGWPLPNLEDYPDPYDLARARSAS